MAFVVIIRSINAVQVASHVRVICTVDSDPVYAIVIACAELPYPLAVSCGIDASNKGVIAAVCRVPFKGALENLATSIGIAVCIDSDSVRPFGA